MHLWSEVDRLHQQVGEDNREYGRKLREEILNNASIKHVNKINPCSTKLRNFSESNDWQLNVEPSLNFAMSSNLSVKLGYLYKYDNEPADGLKRYDSQYTTTLIAKF